MILFCVTECLASFKVGTKKFLHLTFQNCRQTLFIAGKHYLLQEAHRNGWHVALSYRNAILNSELAFPIFNMRAGPACKLFKHLKKRLPAINSVCLQ
jgi:hypothetical protein